MADLDTWSDIDWYCCNFPLQRDGETSLPLDWLIGTLQSLLDQVTEEDTTLRSAVLHVAHILTTLQGSDGKWPAMLNARTGKAMGGDRTFAPIPLFERLNRMLDSSEFDHAILFARTEGYEASVEWTGK